MKEKRKTKLTRGTIIFEKLSYFMEEAKILKSYRSNLLWIERIIDFIDNEFPKNKKYQKMITKLKTLIKEKSYSYPVTTNFKENVMSILVDLITTYDLDRTTDYYINLHPKVQEHSLNLFENGHYAEAIFESVKALNNYVKDKAQIIDKDLSNAMAKAFDENKPIIRLNDLVTRSDKDEQEGFKFLYMGAMKGIRNPKAHDTIKQEDKNKTLEYLAFISLLFRRAEEGKVEKSNNKS